MYSSSWCWNEHKNCTPFCLAILVFFFFSSSSLFGLLDSAFRYTMHGFWFYLFSSVFFFKFCVAFNCVTDFLEFQTRGSEILLMVSPSHLFRKFHFEYIYIYANEFLEMLYPYCMVLLLRRGKKINK